MNEPTEPHCHPDVAEDVTTEDPPHWIQQASLSELLLWRLGIPLDREQMQLDHDKQQEAIDLKPPITTRKVADAIARLSLQLMRGELDANTAKTSLYALQTLLTALRLQFVEDKKPKDISGKKQKPASRRKKIAKRKR